MEERARQKCLPGFEPMAAGPPPAAENVAEAARSAAAPEVAPPESLEGQTVYVVDAHSVIYQVYHALPEMTSPQGEPVGAVYGFARDMLYLLEVKRPDYLFCAFDLPGKTFRHELFDQYKIHRPEMPDDLIPQIASIRRLIDGLGIPAVGGEAVEAGDAGVP